jgi:serine/threonine protein kinase
VAQHTKRSTVIGTPLWMSPELIESGSYGTLPSTHDCERFSERRPPTPYAIYV